MKYVAKFLLGLLLSVSVLFSATAPTFAAMVRADEKIYFSEEEKNLEDVYLFGSSVTIDAPVTNDLVVAGGDLTINGDITGSLMAAGGDIVVRSAINNTARIAGGNIAISGKVDRDLVITGGSVRVTKDASISGDLLFLGGQLRLDGPVKGNVYITGGDITINSTVGKNVEGEIGNLTLGRNAVISGNLTYASENKATLDKNAVIRGKQTHKPPTRAEREEPKGLVRAFTTGAFYKLLIDIAVGLLVVSLFPRLTKKIVDDVSSAPIAVGGTGFIFLFITPLIALILLMLLWLGIATFLLYLLMLIISLFIGKLLIGTWIMRWWTKRNKEEYTPDWKAAIVGAVVSFILFIIPILGWVVGFFIYLLAVGGVTRAFLAFVSDQRNEKALEKKR